MNHAVTASDNMNIQQSTSCYHFYQKTSLLFHILCGTITSCCFIYCLFQPALWMMLSTSGLFLDGKILYFNAFRGFGSNPDCNQFSKVSICAGYGIFCDRFCWLWQIPGPWRAIDHTSHIHSHLAKEASILWFTVPSMMILCAVTALTGTILLIRSLRQSDEYRSLLIQYLRELSQEAEVTNISSKCDSCHRRSCLIPHNSAIFCFFLTSIFSHLFLLGVSLSDTLNPHVWEKFMISLVITITPDQDSVTDPALQILLTSSGWVFFSGMLLSYFIWIGMFLLWAQFPVTCLLRNTTLTNPNLVEVELVSMTFPTRRPQTDSAVDRIQNPILPSPVLQRRFHSV